MAKIFSLIPLRARICFFLIKGSWIFRIYETMKILFKTSNQLPSGTHEMVTHYDFREHYPGINSNTSWNTIAPYIRQATKYYVVPFLGALYNNLADDYNAGGTLPEWKQEIVETLQDAIAHYAMYDVLPILNISVAEMGITQYAASEGTAMPTSQWAFKNARWEILRKADASLDIALSLIESQIKLGQTYFDSYKVSQEYIAKTSAFFKATSDLDEYLNIQGSRRAFISLMKYFTKAEQRYLIPILGQAFYNELAEGLRANNLSELNGKLLPYIRRLVSEYGLYEAIPHLSLIIEGDGFKIVSSTDMYDDKKNLTNFTHRDAIESLKYKAEENGRLARADLIEFLYKNEKDYSTWKESDFYEDPESRKIPVTTSCNQIGGIFI